jgi:hypothetical protein
MFGLIMVIAVLTALFTGLTGAITESNSLALLNVGATVWAVVLGALLLDVRCSPT